ncbi:MAG: hypothetical protein PVJ76_20200 [Gemmatimonadota bacterium]|jgi:hypothetical protein
MFKKWRVEERRIFREPTGSRVFLFNARGSLPTRFSSIYTALALLILGPWSINPEASGQTMELLDPVDCDLKVVDMEVASRISLDEGGEIAPTGRTRRLMLFHLKGVCAMGGCLPLHPSGFGVHYAGEEAPAFSPALAVGVRGETPTGRRYEAWYRDPHDETMLSVESAGEEISVWFAVEIPESVTAVRIRIPALLDGSVPVRLQPSTSTPGGFPPGVLP